MLILRREAEEDIYQAFNWYESQHKGLGHSFLSELERVFEQIQERPQQYTRLQNSLRRALCRRFPYAIYFAQKGDKTVVLAVLHQRRHPVNWLNRIDG